MTGALPSLLVTNKNVSRHCQTSSGCQHHLPEEYKTESRLVVSGLLSWGRSLSSGSPDFRSSSPLLPADTSKCQGPHPMLYWDFALGVTVPASRYGL